MSPAWLGRLARGVRQRQDRQSSREDKHMRRITMLAVCLGLFAGPALAQSKAAIQKLEDQWGAAFNKGDAAAVAAMYAEDAYVLPAGRATAKRKAPAQAPRYN